MTKELVIARYEEDIDWIKNYIDIFDRITIYNKGDDIQLPWFDNPKISIKNLPNVGREAHTYLHHFYTNYDNLCDDIICSQGWYQDKMTTEEYEELIKNGKRRVYLLDIPLDTTINKIHGGDIQQFIFYGEMLSTGLTYREYCETFFRPIRHQQSEMISTFFGIFYVSKNQVHKYTKDTYLNILENSTISKHKNPEDAYYLERLWFYIYNDY